MGFGRVRVSALFVALVTFLPGCSADAGLPSEQLSSAVEQDPVPSASTPTVESTPAVEAAIVITPMTTMDLDQYSEFTYQEAKVVGLTPEATVVANGVLAAMTDPWVAEAIAENETQECLHGEDKCGYFSLTMEWLPCEGGLLCVRRDIRKTGIGLAIGSSYVSAVRIDPQVGFDVPLDKFLGSIETAGFLVSLNESASLIQKVNDFHFEDSPPRYDIESMPAWLPEAEGIRVWFPKYEVGPGFLGIVEARFLSTERGWRSWVLQEGEEVPVLDAGGETDPRSADEGVSPASDIVLVQILGDLKWDLDPRWCRQVNLSNRNPNWGVFAESAMAFDNSEACQLSDSFSYVGKVKGKWRFLDYAGSSVDTCKGMRKGLSEQGMPKVAIEDVMSEMGCLSDEEFGDIVDPGQEHEQPPPGTLQRPPSADLVVVPLVVGLMNKDAERKAGQVGLSLFARAQGGDPSIAAQVNNGCIIVAQNPMPGAVVKRGSVVQGEMLCPSTGQNAPGAPNSWSGPNMGGYTGPPPPQSWTGR